MLQIEDLFVFKNSIKLGWWIQNEYFWGTSSFMILLKGMYFIYKNWEFQLASIFRYYDLAYQTCKTLLLAVPKLTFRKCIFFLHLIYKTYFDLFLVNFIIHTYLRPKFSKMRQLAWPNLNCTAFTYKMPETSKLKMGYTIRYLIQNNPMPKIFYIEKASNLSN